MMLWKFAIIAGPLVRVRFKTVFGTLEKYCATTGEGSKARNNVKRFISNPSNPDTRQENNGLGLVSSPPPLVGTVVPGVVATAGGTVRIVMLVPASEFAPLLDWVRAGAKCTTQFILEFTESRV
jgi:hypothetical protein